MEDALGVFDTTTELTGLLPKKVSLTYDLNSGFIDYKSLFYLRADKIQNGAQALRLYYIFH